MDDATLAAIRTRAAAWEPLCQYVFGNGDPCGYVRGHIFHRAAGLGSPGHRYVYHPTADTSPEADRARLLAAYTDAVAYRAQRDAVRKEYDHQRRALQRAREVIDQQRAELDRLLAEHAECEDGDGR